MFKGLPALLAVGAVLAVQPLPASAEVQMPVSNYFRQYAFSDARLNPSGTLVAALTRKDQDHQYVTIIDLQSQTSADVIVTGGRVEYFTGLQWISDNTVIFTDHVGEYDSRLIAVQWNGLKGVKSPAHVSIWKQGTIFVDPLSMNTNQVVVAHYGYGDSGEGYYLYKADINNSSNKLSEENQLSAFSVPHIAMSKYLMNKNGNVLIEGGEDSGGQWHYYKVGKDGKPWTQFKLVKQDQVFNPVAMNSGGSNLFVFSNIGRNTIGYFEYNLVTGSFSKTLYARDDADITDYIYDWITRKVAVIEWNVGGAPHYEVIDPHLRTYMPELQAAFPQDSVTPIDISRDDHELLVFVSTDTNPGSYYAVNLKTGQAELLGKLTPWFSPGQMAHIQSSSIRTPDGFSVTYLLALPNQAVKPYPLVVIPHGGPIGIFDTTGFDSETQLLVSRGYAVLKVNYRGSGGSGKYFENAGKKQWGRKIEDDIERAVQAVLKSSPIDANRVCIFGESYGGYSAIMSVIRYPNLYKCAASYAGVTDLPLLYDSSGVQSNKIIREDMADIIGNPTTDINHLESFSPVYLADKITRPIFIAQGMKDTRVDPEQAFRLKLVLDALHKPYVFHVYEDEGHGFYKVDDEVDFYTRLLKFLKRNIGTSDEPWKARSAEARSLR